MIKELLCTLRDRILPPPLTPEQHEQRSERDEERIVWIDSAAFHLRNHTRKKVRFIFSPTKNHVTCIVKMGRAKDAPETMIERPFPETEWNMFWPLLTA